METIPLNRRRQRAHAAVGARGESALLRGLQLVVIALVAAISPVHAAEPHEPQRIISLNLCTDQLLVELVPMERIVALSFLATDPSVSPIAGRVASARTVRGQAEEILALDADLVVSAGYSTPATLAILRQLGKPVITAPLAGSFSDIRTAIRVLAAGVGEAERGEALVAAFDRRLEQLRPVDGRRPSALAIQVGSLVSSSGSLLGEAMDWVGLSNEASARQLGRGGRLPLESLVAAPPDLIVLANDPAQFRTAAADNLRHPALRSVLDKRAHLTLPLPTWLCGSPSILEGMQQLSDARARLLADSSGRGRQ